MELFFAFGALSLGAIIGSFLNVVIHRYPREESIVFPASHCPHCNTVIKAYDNVPVLSYLWLRGKCRHCSGSISIRYPLVELANALFYVAIFQRTGLSWVFLPVAAVVSMLIALIYIDAEIQILPDVIDIPGVAVGLIIGLMAGGALHPELILSRSLMDSFIGAGVGSGILLAVALLYKLIRHVEGMGLGDVKMMAMLGAILGWEALPGLLVIASVTGAIVGLLVASRSKEGLRVAIPFGVFLGISALIVMFFGSFLWEQYLTLFAV